CSRDNISMSTPVSDSSITTGRNLAASCIRFSGCAFRSRAVGCSTYWIRSYPPGDLSRTCRKKFTRYPTFGHFSLKSSEYPFLDAALLLRLGRDAVDAQHALDIPLRVVAVQLNLQVGKPVEVDPLGKCFGQTVPDRLDDIRLVQRIDRPDQMVERHAGLGFAADVFARILALVLGPEIVRKIVRHELGAVRVIAVDAMRLAESVVHRGVDSAGRDQRTQTGDWLGEVQALGNLGRGLIVERIEGVVDVDRMPVLAIPAGDLDHLLGQRLHGTKRHVIGHLLRG